MAGNAVLFFAAALLYSQAATAKAIMPAALAVGVGTAASSLLYFVALALGEFELAQLALGCWPPPHPEQGVETGVVLGDRAPERGDAIDLLRACEPDATGV